MKIYSDLQKMIKETSSLLLGPGAYPIKTSTWQGMGDPPEMIETLGVSVRALIPESKEALQYKISPDLPWAEDHFQERVGGAPTNPGKTYEYWPYYQKGDYLKNGKFSHTYQERFWGDQKGYGNYLDLQDLLLRDPWTRQAYLPIFWPEDTGARDKQRIPCTLGYLFTVRGGRMHLTYYIRSCDAIRHFKNDVYMAMRLVQHTLKDLSTILMDDPYPKPEFDKKIKWKDIKPGILTMHIESFHIFSTDKYELKKRIK